MSLEVSTAGASLPFANEHIREDCGKTLGSNELRQLQQPMGEVSYRAASSLHLRASFTHRNDGASTYFPRRRKKEHSIPSVASNREHALCGSASRKMSAAGQLRKEVNVRRSADRKPVSLGTCEEC